MNHPSPRSLEKQPDVELYGRANLEDATQGTNFQGDAAATAGYDTDEHPEDARFYAVLTALCLAVFLMALDQTAIGTAITRISDDLNALQGIGWYGSAYMLTCCAFQAIFGRLYNLFSLKWIFILSFSIFEIGSLLCAMAQTSLFLICGRAVAGVGGAGIYSGAAAIVSYSVHLHRRSLFTGILVAMFGIACAAGPLLGGILTDSRLTWRWLFWLNMPFGAVVLLIIILLLRTPAPSYGELSAREKLAKFDLFGPACLIPAIFTLLLGLQWAGTKYSWQDKHVMGLMGGSGALLIAFAVIQYFKGENATMPPRIMTERSVGSAAHFAICIGGALFMLIYYVPLWFQTIQGVSATQSAIQTLPLLLSFVIAAFVAAMCIKAWGYYAPFMILSSVVTSIGAGFLTTLTMDTSTGSWIGYLIITGVGLGFGLQQPLTAVKTVLEVEDIGTVTSIIVLFQSLGGAIFITLAENLLKNDLLDGLKTAIPNFEQSMIDTAGPTTLKIFVPLDAELVIAAFNHALTRTFVIAASLGIVSIVGSLAIEWKSVKRRTW